MGYTTAKECAAHEPDLINGMKLEFAFHAGYAACLKKQYVSGSINTQTFVSQMAGLIRLMDEVSGRASGAKRLDV